MNSNNDDDDDSTTVIKTNNTFDYDYNFNYKEIIKDIPYFKEWKKVIPVYKGFSNDLKFKIIKENDELLLLRLSDSKFEKEKRIEFEISKVFNSVMNSNDGSDDDYDVLMSKAIDIGLCNNGNNLWVLLTWIEGEDFNEILNQLSINKQYELGIKAGKLQKRIHSIPINNISISGGSITYKELIEIQTYNRDDLERRLNTLRTFELDNKFRFQGDQVIIDYVKLNLPIITKQCFINQGNSLVLKHNDFHSGNMILHNGNKLGLIDFNRFTFGYGYEEFQKTQAFTIDVSIPFCVGQIDGYFSENGGIPPIEFWNSLTTFVAMSCLSMTVWAGTISEAEVNKSKERCKRNLDHFDNLNLKIPKWYTQFKEENNHKK